ncbi:MAG: tetratricopeptide repeat protein [Acidobacteriota bacterium]|nr:tetratricopeptide repeat protein [Acidobacteriota bacterium]
MAVLAGLAATASAQPHQRSPSSNSLTIKTEPNAIIWLDEIRRGTTDNTGKLVLDKVTSGRHNLRVRANSFKEAAMLLLPGRRGTVSIRLVHTTDEAELAFQQGEEAREKANDDDSRRQAVELYRGALKLRARFPAAQVGLARVLLELNKYQDGLTAIEAARLARAIYPEASAVEGRIYREMAFTEEAIKSFQRAIREARGFQPEAHVGLARIYEERGQYEAAATEFETAIKQLSDSEPVIYQLLGAIYEKLEKYKEAVAAYEKYLELAPNGNLAPAVRSIIDQLRREAAGQQLNPK